MGRIALYQKPPVIPVQINKKISIEADEASNVRDTSQYYLQSKSDKRQSYIHEDCGTERPSTGSQSYKSLSDKNTISQKVQDIKR